MTELCLRGGRDYLHGTTIFDYIVGLLADEGLKPRKIDFRMNKLTNRQILIRERNTNEGVGEGVVGEFRCDTRELDIMEMDEEIHKRCPYDEDTLMNACIFEQARIFVPREKSVNYTPIEKIISGNKFLLKREFSEREKSYLFARLLLDYIPGGDIKIAFNRIISNRYFESKIFEEDRAIGLIYFGFKE